MRFADHQFYSFRHDDARHHFDADEARHAGRALRLKPGDRLLWVDGRGGRFAGRLVALDPKGMTAFAERQTSDPAPPVRTLGVGVLHDAGRLEWLVEKAVELGATRIALLRTERVERSRHRLARLEAKALAAMKQSQRAYLPELAEIDFSEFLAVQHTDRQLIAHCYDDLPRVLLYTVDLRVASESVSLLIGPEGDFVPGEIEAAEALGWTGVSLGDARLRTETAALAGLTWAMAQTLIATNPR